jgi:hypothetical protein
MNHPPKKEETQSEAASPSQNETTTEPNLPVKRVKLTPEIISQEEIDKINAIHERMLRNVNKIAKDSELAGKMLSAVKGRLPHGRWGQWVKANLHFTIRTATRYMKAYENREALLEIGPEVFLRQLWGNEPAKQLNAVEPSASETETDDEEDLTQHGGEGPNFGGDDDFIKDKGQASFHAFKNLVAKLDHEFLASKEYTREAKLKFITELITWLENRKKHLLTASETTTDQIDTTISKRN